MTQLRIMDFSEWLEANPDMKGGKKTRRICSKCRDSCGNIIGVNPPPCAVCGNNGVVYLTPYEIYKEQVDKDLEFARRAKIQLANAPKSE